MNFSELPLKEKIKKNLDSLGYKQMTPVQAEALPVILQGYNVVAKAKTGSGKTAAFGIAILQNLNIKNFRLQALILCPTRELANQVTKELRRLARTMHNIKILTLTGGSSFEKQLNSLAHHAHIIVGTPGRTLKHLNKKTLSLKDLSTFVLDEADKMLDMGFIEEVQEIMNYLPLKHQTLLFSATYNNEMKTITKKLLNNSAVEIETTESETPNEIEEIFYRTKNKIETLVALLSDKKPKNAIIFTNTKIEAKELATKLFDLNIEASALHGDLEQYERNDILVQFANGSIPILTATDIASRGVDIKKLAMVINYTLPYTKETYIHRIGRTARAGEKGIAVTLYEPFQEKEALEYKEGKRKFLDTNSLKKTLSFAMRPEFATLVIEAKKREKLRAGDILGALTGDAGLEGTSIGKIDIYEREAYVAIKTQNIETAFNYLKKGKIKNKKFSVWLLKSL